MYPDNDAELNKQTDKEVYFFTPAFHALDPFSAHTVALWGKTFPTAEHAYQWKKYAHTPIIADRILTAKSPHAVKAISDANKAHANSRWDEEKVAVLEEVFRAKHAQHEDVRETLKRTGDREIIENSPIDSFWGAGPHKNGKNMIGKLWMKIRDEH